jgi:hypothetical protein
MDTTSLAGPDGRICWPHGDHVHCGQAAGVPAAVAHRRPAIAPDQRRASMTACLRSWPRCALHLLVLVFIVVQPTALAHEVQHVLHLHDGLCGLHIASDHLAMAPAPEPASAVARPPATEQLLSFPGARLSPPARPSGARAPPFLSS